MTCQRNADPALCNTSLQTVVRTTECHRKHKGHFYLVMMLADPKISHLGLNCLFEALECMRYSQSITLTNPYRPPYPFSIKHGIWYIWFTKRLFLTLEICSLWWTRPCLSSFVLQIVTNDYLIQPVLLGLLREEFALSLFAWLIASIWSYGHIDNMAQRNKTIFVIVITPVSRIPVFCSMPSRNV